jgi:hypothetical protein
MNRLSGLVSIGLAAFLYLNVAALFVTALLLIKAHLLADLSDSLRETSKIYPIISQLVFQFY